jgi:aminoglycoside phosphotransferase (APT) family kinase protein
MASFPADPPVYVIDWVSAEMGPRARIIAIRPMARSSTDQHAVDLRDGSGRLHRLVLRRYVDAHRLANDPWYRPEQEAEALGILEQAALPAPRLMAQDLAARRCDVPALLVTRVNGRALRQRPAHMEAYLGGAAEMLHRIHAVEASHAVRLPRYAPYWPPSTLPIPPWSSHPELWERVLDLLAGPPPEAEAGFIHRDYHPGNVLVAGGRVSGVVDWTTACRGPRSIDLARMRLNLAGDFGSEVADRFLDVYRLQAAPGWSHDPYWDLLDAVDAAQDARLPRTAARSAAWERFERWVGSVLAALDR